MKHRFLLSTILVVWLISCLCWGPEKVGAQTSPMQLVPKVFSKDDGTEPSKETKPLCLPLPGLAEVVPRATDLGQRAVKAEEAVALLRDTSALDKRLADIKSQVKQITQKMDDTGDLANWNIYRLLDVRRLIQGEREKLTLLMGSISDRLSKLEDVRKQWEEEHTLWKKWEESLKKSQTEIPIDCFKKVQHTIDAIVQSASDASAPLLALQQKLTKQLDDVQKMSIPVEVALKKVRGEIFQKNTPFFFSREFFDQFDTALWAALKGGLTDGWKVDRDVFQSYVWMMFLHILGIVTLAYLIRHRRWLPEKTSEWHFIKEHAWAFSVFTIQAFTAFFYQDSASSWLLLTLALVILSASFLVSDMLPHPRLRMVLFMLAGVQIISAVLKLISFPMPLYSLYMALICIGGIVGLLRLARRHVAERGGKVDLLSVGLRGAALVALAAFLMLLAGYSNLADYLIRSSVGTVFLIVIALLLFHLGNGCIEVVLKQPSVSRLEFFSRFGAAFKSRMKNLLKAILWIGVFLTLFQLWGIYPSMGQVWEKILQFKFAIGEVTISLGRVLMSVLLLYLVVSSSWFIRAFLDGEVFPRQQIDYGARDAIKKLIHYSLLFFGVALTISVLGLNLTSFAFLTGAVGIGVGFGLQNIVNNFVSGLMLLFERPFKVGDMIVVDDETGTVKKIGLRSTVIETLDRSDLIVPNSQFISEKVMNWTHTNHIARIRIPVGVAYGSDVARVLQLLKKAAESDPRVLKEPAPNPLFLRFGDSSLDFELHCWLADVKERLIVKSNLCQEIDKSFREAGIEIPFPQSDLHLRSVEKSVLEQILGVRKKDEEA